MRKVDVVVIGAGQAGLATSYYLTQRGIDHVVLERGRVADSWATKRWDSFALNAPNWAFVLPGYQYDGPDPDAFMGRAELVARFTDYARHIDAPVQEQTEVASVSRDPVTGSYLLDTTAGRIEARAVVVASGAYQRRNRPPTGLDSSIMQINTDEYRNLAQLQPGGVLVVGSGQSGCQVAEDLRENGREVWMATGTCGWIPRRYRGKDNVAWRSEMGIFDETVEKLGPALRLACPAMQTGVEGGRDINLTILRTEGIHLVGRFLAGDGFKVTFGDDLEANATNADKAALALLPRIDDYIAANGLDAPPADEFVPVDRDDFSGAPTQLDLRANDITNVVWATGFHLDFSWIDLDLNLTPQGYPDQAQGVSPHTGLYFMGLQLMHTRKSGLIFGVGEDAAHVSSVIARQLGAS